MPIARIVTAEDFEKAPRGRRLSDHWRVRTPLDSPVGTFDIELDAPPDDELLARANELIAAVTNQHGAILRLIYADYERAAEDRHWMKGCGVPRHLETDQVTQYLRYRAISVHRDQKGRISGSIFISPLWEIEHGIYIGVMNGRLVPLSI